MFKKQKKERITYPKGEFGILHDGAIVKIWAWTEPDENQPDEVITSQEIYFLYLFWYKIKHRRKSAWAFETDFIGFSKTKRGARKLRRKIKKDERKRIK